MLEPSTIIGDDVRSGGRVAGYSSEFCEEKNDLCFFSPERSTQAYFLYSLKIMASDLGISNESIKIIQTSELFDSRQWTFVDTVRVGYYVLLCRLVFCLLKLKVAYRTRIVVYRIVP